MSDEAWQRDLVFYVNGKRTVVHDPDPQGCERRVRWGSEI